MELWDINCLLGRWPSAQLLFEDVPGLLRRMDQLGIRRAAVGHADCLHYDVVSGNTRLMDMVAQEAQFIIATHSPLLLAFPDATIYSFDRAPLAAVAYEELDHVSLTRDFLNDPGAFLRRLRNDP